VVYKKVNDVEIHADVYLSKHSLPGLPPCVYYAHGGSFIFGDRKLYPVHQIAEMLRRGWAVVSIDYRLGPNAAMKDIYEDAVDCYTWIRRELNSQVDVNRIAIWGHSAGGTIAEAAGYIMYPRPKALVSFYGVSDFTINYNPDPSQPAPEYSELAKQVTSGRPIILDSKQVEQIKAGKPIDLKDLEGNPTQMLVAQIQKSGKISEVFMHSKDINVIKKYSPVNNIGLDYPPIYLVHGDSDVLVPYQNSVIFAELAKEKGIPHELRIVSGGHHFFDEDKSNDGNEIWDRYIAPAFDFVQKYL